MQVAYNYNNGYLETITIGNQEYWRANKYDALGRIKEDTLGDLVTTDRTFDPEQGVWIK